MINIDFISIDNAKLIGRLLPFWARGKRISLLLQALLSPITTPYTRFKAWALERYIECHITAQKASLEWYLKYRLKFHFLNENDDFYITHSDEVISCFSTGEWINEKPWNNSALWKKNKDGNSSNVDTDELSNQTTVYAPEIVDTVDYNHEDYERDIRYIMSKFMINFNKIKIIIANTSD